MQKFYQDLDFNNHQFINAVMQTTAPGASPAPVAGRFYFDTTAKTMKLYDGTQWCSMGFDKTITAVDGKVMVSFNATDDLKSLEEVTILSASTMKTIAATDTTLLKILQAFDTHIRTLNSLTIVKEATAETGFLATYKLMKSTWSGSPETETQTQVGASINIPKDFLVKSATVKTCTEDDKPVAGYKVGDKYIDFVINSKDASATDEHLYIKCTDIAPTLVAGDGISIENNTKIKVNLSTTNANGLNIEAASTSGDPGLLALSLATDSANGAMKKEDYDFLHGEYIGAYTAVITNGTGALVIKKADEGTVVGHNLDEIYMFNFVDTDYNICSFDIDVDATTKDVTINIGTETFNGRVVLFGLRTR